MKFRIEPFNEREQDYGPAVVGESGGVEGPEAVAKAFENAGVTTAGCYRVRPEMSPEDPAAFYNLTATGDVLIRDTDCS